MSFHLLRNRFAALLILVVGLFALPPGMELLTPQQVFAQHSVRFVTPSVPQYTPVATPVVQPPLPTYGTGTSGNIQENPLRMPVPGTTPPSPAVLFIPPTNPIRDAADVVPTLEFTPGNRASLPAAQPLPIERAEEQAAVEAILREAARLEAEHRWAELCKFYDNALQIHRNHPLLTEKHAAARHHYDIVCRYHDSSFINLLLQADMADNLVLFDEVTKKIQSDHIDAPHWSQLFRHGLHNFEIALTESAFLKTNGVEARQDRIAPFLRNVHAVADTWRIGSPSEMKQGVLYVAQMAEQQVGIPQGAVLLEFMCGVANSLDPYTAFLTKTQLNDQYSMIDGKYVGIGVELNSDYQSPFISRVISGSPAQEAGLLEGDRILAVNGHATQGLDAHRTGDLLQGEVDTVTRLQVQTQGQQARQVEIRLRRIDVPSVEDVRMLDGSTAYFRLTCFQSTTTEEVRQALWKLHGLGMRCLVIDLRHNPGGLFPVAVDVVNLFIEKGTIVSTRVHPQDPGTPYLATPGGTWTVPMIVLIDRNSASASEIFAGAIRDHGRGIIIGNRSYGKGTVQTVHPLDGAMKNSRIAGLKVTIQKYYSPSGLSCSGIGVVPDVEISDLLPSLGPQVVARPIDGQLPIQAASTFRLPEVRRPSSSPTDPCITQAVETARRLVPPAATPLYGSR